MRAASMWPGFRRCRGCNHGGDLSRPLCRGRRHSGHACGAARDLPSVFAAMRGAGIGTAPRSAKRAVMPTIVFHGDQDKTVHPRNGAEVIARASVEGHWKSVSAKDDAQGHKYTCSVLRDRSGQIVTEKWEIHGGGHAWSGGSRAGSYTDPAGAGCYGSHAEVFSRPQDAECRGHGK
jgi:poly(3-hydroxybutyrate) depolymerase